MRRERTHTHTQRQGQHELAENSHVRLRHDTLRVGNDHGSHPLKNRFLSDAAVMAQGEHEPREGVLCMKPVNSHSPRTQTRRPRTR